MSKYSSEIKIKACEDYLSGNLSHKDICMKYGIHFDEKKCKSMLNEWLPIYREHGPSAFIKTGGNRTYTSKFKENAVIEYLSGEGSYNDIAAKYNLRSKSQLQNWVSLYNANRELKDYCPNREVYMAEARRKTTIEERKEIVAYCIEHNRNYKETASHYDVSYSQVYSWVKKYDEKGDDGLLDKRGHHKSDDELSELELLRRENIRLKKKLEEQERIALLLKKVQEFERM